MIVANSCNGTRRLFDTVPILRRCLPHMLPLPLPQLQYAAVRPAPPTTLKERPAPTHLVLLVLAEQDMEGHRKPHHDEQHEEQVCTTAPRARVSRVENARERGECSQPCDREQ